MFSSTEIPRKKCGQIFLLSDDSFLLICEFCEDNFFTLDDLRDHHIRDHVNFPKLPLPTIIKEENSPVSCKAESVKQEFIDSLQETSLRETSLPVSDEMCNQNEVVQLKRTRELQPKSEKENDNTTESTEKKAAYKRFREPMENSIPVPVILNEIYQIETNRMKGFRTHIRKQCLNCPKTFSSSKSLMNHMKWHSLRRGKDLKNSVPVPAIFSEINQNDSNGSKGTNKVLKLRIEPKRVRKAGVECKFCAKKCQTTSGLNFHETRAHASLQCRMCSKAFSSYKTFSNHKKLHNLGRA